MRTLEGHHGVPFVYAPIPALSLLSPFVRTFAIDVAFGVVAGLVALRTLTTLTLSHNKLTGNINFAPLGASLWAGTTVIRSNFHSQS